MSSFVVSLSSSWQRLLQLRCRHLQLPFLALTVPLSPSSLWQQQLQLCCQHLQQHSLAFDARRLFCSSTCSPHSVSSSCGRDVILNHIIFACLYRAWHSLMCPLCGLASRRSLRPFLNVMSHAPTTVLYLPALPFFRRHNVNVNVNCVAERVHGVTSRRHVRCWVFRDVGWRVSSSCVPCCVPRMQCCFRHCAECICTLSVRCAFHLGCDC